MKELSVIEMSDVSGAYTWDFTDAWSFVGNVASNAVELVGAAAIGASVGGAAGAIIGGKHGGDGGGLIGVGSIGQGVGMLGGGIIGAITMGITAACVGWDTTANYVTEAIEGIINGTLG